MKKTSSHDVIDRARQNIIELTGQGRLDDATAQARGLCERFALDADAWLIYGTVLGLKGNLSAAIDCFDKAVSIDPAFFDGYFNRGIALQNQSRRQQAILSYRTALRLKPNHVHALNNLANCLSETGEYREALACLEKALSTAPGFVEAKNNLGTVHRLLGNLDTALECYRQVLKARPEFFLAHLNMGNVFSARLQFDEAIVAYKAALAIKPNDPDALNGLANALLKTGYVQAAIDIYREALKHGTSTSHFHSNLLMALNYLDLSLGDIAAEHRAWAQRHVPPQVSTHRDTHAPPRKDGPLRLGFVSPDFGAHPVGAFFEALLAQHVGAGIECYCYANVETPDIVTERFMSMAHKWRDLRGLDDAEGAALVRKDDIDILIDLAGHTARNRLLIFAHRPAPIQASYLGYCTTSGMDEIKYRITDAIVDPPGVDPHYSECLLRIPDGCYCYLPATDAPAVSALPARNKGYVTFGSLVTLAKIGSQTLALWAQVLRRVPRSRLLIFRDGLTPTVRENLSSQLMAHGVAPHRIDFRCRDPHQLHFAAYHAIDIVLDSVPWNGHTTTCEALWMGVPVVTLLGRPGAGRGSASVLHSAGFGAWVANTPAEYVEIAAALALDVSRLANIRGKMRAHLRQSRLLDGDIVGKDLCNTYRQMWQETCLETRGNFPEL